MQYTTKTILINGRKVTIQRPVLTPEETKRAESRVKTAMLKMKEEKQ